MKADNPLPGRRVWIVTKHKKEQAIAPVLEKKLGVKCGVYSQLDTDRFGTFTGEIARTGSAWDAARLKCLAAATEVKNDLVLASEGSFGPHPYVPFAYADEEVLLLMDPLAKREWKVRVLSGRTNFATLTTDDEAHLLNFCRQCGFPSHAVILRTIAQNPVVVKGITSKTALLYHFRKLEKSGQAVQVETDMRAMYNPTRMEIIGRAARQLASLLLRACPQCGAPGFAVVRHIPGLPCAWCGAATLITQAVVYHCAACGREEYKTLSKGQATADPMYCQQCNP